MFEESIFFVTFEHIILFFSSSVHCTIRGLLLFFIFIKNTIEKQTNSVIFNLNLFTSFFFDGQRLIFQRNTLNSWWTKVNFSKEHFEQLMNKGYFFKGTLWTVDGQRLIFQRNTLNIWWTRLIFQRNPLNSSWTKVKLFYLKDAIYR